MSLANSGPGAPGSPWFGSVADCAGSARLFLFPFAGGNAVSFFGWQELLGPEVELHVALLPGRGARLFEEPPHDLDELVAQLTVAIAGLADKPFAFFGHSLGALLAFEVARALRRQGLPGPDSLWVGGAEGPQTRLVQRRFHDLTDANLTQTLRDFNATPAELLADPEMMQLLLPGIRADFALAECYTYAAETPLDVPIHVLLGDQDHSTDADRAAGWARESTRPVRQYVYAGDHFFIWPHQVAITALLAGAVGHGSLAARGSSPAIADI